MQFKEAFNHRVIWSHIVEHELTQLIHWTQFIHQVASLYRKPFSIYFKFEQIITCTYIFFAVNKTNINEQSLLSTTRASSIFYGYISFSFAAPHRLFAIVFLCIFTRLLLYKLFKSLLKTYLFEAAYLYNLLICNLYLSLIVYFIVLFMRLEAFRIRRFTNVFISSTIIRCCSVNAIL